MYQNVCYFNRSTPFNFKIAFILSIFLFLSNQTSADPDANHPFAGNKGKLMKKGEALEPDANVFNTLLPARGSHPIMGNKEKSKIKISHALETQDPVEKSRAMEKMMHKIVQCENVCDKVPLIDFRNDLATEIKVDYQNQLEGRRSRYERIGDTHYIEHNENIDVILNIPRHRQSMVGAIIWSARVPCEATNRDVLSRALDQIDVITRLIMKYPKFFEIAKNSDEIWETFHRGKIASLFGISGGHLLDNRLSVLRLYYRLGARYLTLTDQNCSTTWSNSWTVDLNSTFADPGLTNFGRTVIQEAFRIGMIINLSHSSRNTILQTLDLAKTHEVPVIFGSSNVYSLWGDMRNVQDDILEKIKENGGLIMVSFDPYLLGTTKIELLVHLAKHLNYIKCKIGIDHVGFGAVFDGNSAVNDASLYLDLVAFLRSPHRGSERWTVVELRKLIGENFLRVFEKVQAASKRISLRAATFENRITQEEMLKDKKFGICRTDLETYDVRYTAENKSADFMNEYENYSRMLRNDCRKNPSGSGCFPFNFKPTKQKV